MEGRRHAWRTREDSTTQSHLLAREASTSTLVVGPLGLKQSDLFAKFSWGSHDSVKPQARSQESGARRIGMGAKKKKKKTKKKRKRKKYIRVYRL